MATKIRLRNTPQVFADNETLDLPVDPLHRPPPPLSVLTNIECDRLASDTSRLAILGEARQDMPPTLTPPYPGSRAMLRIGQTWITSSYKKHLLRAQWSDPIIQYCQSKYRWTSEVVPDISWPSIRAARNKCTPTQTMQTSKIMHDWLPVMHMQAHMTGAAQCPSCSCPDETLDHIFHCRHPLLLSKREELLEHLRKKGLKPGIPRPVLDALLVLLLSYFTETPPPIEFASSIISKAALAQITIGLQFLPRGFLTTCWINALESHGCPHPHRALASLIYFLWIEVTDSIWRLRNNITHDGMNLNTLAQERDTTDKLQWFATNYREVLAPHDFKLVETFLLQPTDALTFRIKRQWLVHLETAQAAHAAHLLQPVRGQQLLTWYFQPMPAPHG